MKQEIVFSAWKPNYFPCGLVIQDLPETHCLSWDTRKIMTSNFSHILYTRWDIQLYKWYLKAVYTSLVHYRNPTERGGREQTRPNQTTNQLDRGPVEREDKNAVPAPTVLQAHARQPRPEVGTHCVNNSRRPQERGPQGGPLCRPWWSSQTWRHFVVALHINHRHAPVLASECRQGIHRTV